MLAHPHAWVSLRSTVLFDGDDQAVGIEHEWAFDRVTSMMTIDGLPDGEQRAEALQALAGTIVSDLRAHDYYTRATQAGADVALGTVDRFAAQIHDGHLWIRFVVPFAKTLHLSAGDLQYGIADPTYYVGLSHLEAGGVRLSGPGSGRCAAPADATEPERRSGAVRPIARSYRNRR